MQPHIPQSIPSLAPQNGVPSQHNYGTRIRKNSVLKPSARLRQSPPPLHPAPRRIKPVPVPASQRQQPPQENPALPVFPLPNVMLHPEDASNKVFQAIGRSFLSVDNRAMTIKDLAEMTLKYGLVCQNVSAASQAITTYIRNHLSRCEAQQDHPLLLRHVLSGTPADDDLVLALHSRVGGATSPSKPSLKETGMEDKKAAQALPGTHEGERLTNFRRGTMVWYLSKAAGVPCPFTRAGIRLCEYGKEGKIVPGNRPASGSKGKRGQAQCGEKRKRLRRGGRQTSEGSEGRRSADPGSPSPAVDSGHGEVSTDFTDSSESDGEPPPKVKLTLRLRPGASDPPSREVIDLSSDTPSSSSEDEADDSVADGTMRMASPDVPWRLPPYPRRSIIVPCYIPACDDRLHPFTALPQSHPSHDERRRSPSATCSASPPPDSDHDGLDFDLDADSEPEWDPSILASPAVPVKIACDEGQHPVKQEPLDVRDMLDAWEDLDCAPTNPSTVSSATVKLPNTEDIRLEELEFWEWEFDSGWAGASHPHEDINAGVKMEVDEPVGLCPLSLESLVSPGPAFSVSPSSPFTSSTSSNLSEPSPTSEAAIGSFTFGRPCSPLPSSMCPPSGRLHAQATRKDSALTWKDVELLGPDTVHPQEFEDGWTDKGRSRVDPGPNPPRVSQEPNARAWPDELLDERGSSSSAGDQDVASVAEVLEARPAIQLDTEATNVVVVHTCQPCVPAISATQVEGISVYQTTLGSTTLLRRIDTDFVNLSCILFHLSLPTPAPLPQACIVISHSSPVINGIWAPLSVARVYATGLPEGTKDIFLSDELVMRFPTALQDFHRKSTPGRMLNQFGPCFRSSTPSHGPSPRHPATRGPVIGEKETVWESSADAGSVEEPMFPILPSYDLAFAALRPFVSEDNTTEVPLSATEQEMFRALCVHPDWEAEKELDVVDIECGGTGLVESPIRNRDEVPLRRSKRVADAAAARSRAVPPRTRGPRHS